MMSEESIKSKKQIAGILSLFLLFVLTPIQAGDLSVHVSLIKNQTDIENVNMNNLLHQQPSVINVTGKITNYDGEPIVGANIIEKGTTNGTVTDIDGNFSFNVSSGAVLQVTYIGFLSQEIPIGGNTYFNILLEEDAKALEELVVIGYGTVRKSDLTGSVSSIKAEEINAF